MKKKLKKKLKKKFQIFSKTFFLDGLNASDVTGRGVIWFSKNFDFFYFDRAGPFSARPAPGLGPWLISWKWKTSSVYKLSSPTQLIILQYTLTVCFLLINEYSHVFFKCWIGKSTFSTSVVQVIRLDQFKSWKWSWDFWIINWKRNVWVGTKTCIISRLNSACKTYNSS